MDVLIGEKRSKIIGIKIFYSDLENVKNTFKIKVFHRCLKGDDDFVILQLCDDFVHYKCTN